MTTLRKFRFVRHLSAAYQATKKGSYSSSVGSDSEEDAQGTDDSVPEKHSPDTKDGNYKCNYCQHSTESPSALKQHKKAVHMGLRNHQCDQCDAAFAKETTLKYHLKAVHLRERNYICDQCKTTFLTPSQLKRHIKAVHLKIKDQSCD